MGILLTDILSQLTNTHKRIINDLVEQNPSVPLHSIASKLNDMPEMMTCHTEITPDILKQLGYQSGAGEDESAATEISAQPDEAHRPLSVEVLRRQLERRHAKIQDRIETLLDDDAISGSQLKTVEMLAKIDDGIYTKLLDIMGQESTPVLPQSIIIACLRRHGVPDEDIQVIESFRIA